MANDKIDSNKKLGYIALVTALLSLLSSLINIIKDLIDLFNN